jgi:hypothetical protein
LLLRYDSKYIAYMVNILGLAQVNRNSCLKLALNRKKNMKRKKSDHLDQMIITIVLSEGRTHDLRIARMLPN